MTEFPRSATSGLLTSIWAGLMALGHILPASVPRHVVGPGDDPNPRSSFRADGACILGTPTRLTFINHTLGSLLTGQMHASQVQRAQRAQPEDSRYWNFLHAVDSTQCMVTPGRPCLVKLSTGYSEFPGEPRRTDIQHIRTGDGVHARMPPSRAEHYVASTIVISLL